MKWWALFSLSAIFLARSAFAAAPGEIVQVSRDGVIRFYLGDFVVMNGEKLRVIDSRGESDRFVVVTKVDPPYAEARFDSLIFHQFEELEPIQVGQRIKLEVAQRELKALSFFGGANGAPTAGAFGGTNWFLGLSMRGYYAQDWLWQVNLQADSLGKDASGTEVRRASYMAGAGYEWRQLYAIAHIGLLDTMTIVNGAPSPTYVDPYTGVAYGPNGVGHSTKAGFLLELARRFDISRVSRTSKFGWSISPRVSYANTFSSTVYRGLFSYGVGVDLWFD